MGGTFDVLKCPVKLCGHRNSSRARFCARCGHELPQPNSSDEIKSPKLLQRCPASEDTGLCPTCRGAGINVPEQRKYKFRVVCNVSIVSLYLIGMLAVGKRVTELGLVLCILMVVGSLYNWYRVFNPGDCESCGASGQTEHNLHDTVSKRTRQ